MASYQTERERFIVRVVQEGLSYDVACTLLRCATTINRLAELACSSEAADRDRVLCPHHPASTRKGPCLCSGYGSLETVTGENTQGEPVTRDVHGKIPRYMISDWNAEQRAKAAVPAGWRVITEGDPRGYTLKVIPPSYAERNQGKDRFNLDAIGVPPRESGIRW